MEAMKQNFLVHGFFKNRGYESSSDLGKDEIAQLPGTTPIKTFTFDSKQLFDRADTAKPKNQKTLRAAGQFLTDTEFGIAVVVVSAGGSGDAQKDLVLTQAPAMVVRDYSLAISPLTTGNSRLWVSAKERARLRNSPGAP
jgi:hypothetical protein